MKKCNSCNKELDLSCFNKNKHRSDGLQTSCRDCSHQNFKRYYVKNKARHIKHVKNKYRLKLKIMRKAIDTMKLNIAGCLLCEEKEFCCLAFHHLDAKSKIDNVSKVVVDNVKWNTVLEEIKKCVVLCSNCHIKLHHGLLTLPDISYDNYYKILLDGVESLICDEIDS